MPNEEPSYGEYVRMVRTVRGVSLRQFAREVGVTPGYQSNMERGLDRFPPPSVDVIIKSAKALNHDADELLALAGRVSPDLVEASTADPRRMANLIRRNRK